MKRPTARPARRPTLLLVTALLISTLLGAETAWEEGARAETTPVLDVFDTFAVEGSASGTTVVVVVLSGWAAETVYATFTTSDGTASSPSDYTGVTQTIELHPGTQHVKMEIGIVDDGDAEEHEEFGVTLSDPTGAVIGDGAARMLIVDDDGGPARDCDDGNPYTGDGFDEAAGYCTHTVRSLADDDGDRVAAAWVGGRDCDDSDATVKPKVEDVAGDGIDNNCDGLVDGMSPRNCDDGNGYTSDRYNGTHGWCTHALLTGSDFDADGWVAAWVGGPDCADGDATVHPGSSDIPDAADNNCDGLIDRAVGTLGTVTAFDIGPPWECPTGAACTALTVECQDTPPARAHVAISSPTTATRGLLVLFLGSEGAGFWDSKGDITADLLARGFQLARVSWPDGWNNTLPSGPYGLDTAACRPATVIEWLHETRYAPLGLSHADGVCGFCIGGHSAGGVQAGYALSDYGLDGIVDALVAGSGPIPAAVAEACLGDSAYTISRATVIDTAYGVDGWDGPCATHDASMEPQWREDSLVDGGTDYVHPTTRVVFLLGGLDHTTAQAHAEAYLDRLVAAGSPLVTERVFPNAGHGLPKFLADPEARAALLEEFSYLPSS